MLEDALRVSIRSPHKSKGRQSSLYRHRLLSRFQSAPLTKARGDSTWVGCQWSLKSFNPLPSQKQGETVVLAVLTLATVVSIRSPHKSKGRLVGANDLADPLVCFNPLPSQKQGETCLGLGGTSGDVGFQSAPLTKARGDTCIRVWLGAQAPFQSAPLTKARGDL